MFWILMFLLSFYTDPLVRRVFDPEGIIVFCGSFYTDPLVRRVADSLTVKNLRMFLYRPARKAGRFRVVF